MTTKTDKDLETGIALRHGAQALRCMREALQYAAQEIARYEHQFEKTDDLDVKAKTLNWAINYICTSVMNNARIDLVAAAQAELLAIAKCADSP